MKTGITVLLSILFTGTLYAQQAAVNKTENNTLTIPFTTSDVPGEYLITVEGFRKTEQQSAEHTK